MTKEELIKHLHEALNSVDITFPYRYVLVEAIEALSQPFLPDGLEEAAEEYAEKHGFRVPYDGSNNFYDDVDVKASKEGFIAGAEWGAEHLKK